jgi:hypothetical protein
MLLFNTHPLNRHPRSDVLNYAQTPSGARAEIGSIRPTACRKQDVKHTEACAMISRRRFIGG